MGTAARLPSWVWPRSRAKLDVAPTPFKGVIVRTRDSWGVSPQSLLAGVCFSRIRRGTLASRNISPTLSSALPESYSASLLIATNRRGSNSSVFRHALLCNHDLYIEGSPLWLCPSNSAPRTNVILFWAERAKLKKIKQTVLPQDCALCGMGHRGGEFSGPPSMDYLKTYTDRGQALTVHLVQRVFEI